jgi:hypothetical protein
MVRYRAQIAAHRDVIEHFDPREPEPFREPVPCSACDGHGGSASEGHCNVCQGTGIDPDDPQSPL